jgi:outer membrane protein OmpA-like peptidoglycan-associated protein
MRSRLLIAVLSLAVASRAQAEDLDRSGPELRTGERVSGTERLKPYEVRVGTAAGFYAGDSVLFFGDTHRTYGQQFQLAYGASENLTLFADFAWLTAYNDMVDPKRLHAGGDTRLAGRFPLWEQDNLKFGADAALHLYSGLPGKTDVFDGASASLRQTGSYRYDRFGLAYHAGFFYDRSEGVISEKPTLMEATTYGFSGYNQLLAGVRADAEIGLFQPYVEYAGKYPLGAPVAAGKGPQWITPGLAVRLFSATVVNAGVAVGLTAAQKNGVEAALPWTAQLGIQQTFDLSDLPYKLRQTFTPQSTTLQLVAKNVLTGQIMPDVDLVVFAPEGPVRDKGGITWTGFAERVSYTASLADYLPVTGYTALRGGQIATVTVSMTPTVGWAKGSAMNLAGAEPVSLYFNGLTTPTWTGLGAFRLSVPPGRYIGYASAPSAVTQPVAFAVDFGQTVDLPRISLRKPPPPVPVIVIPELPAENAPDRKEAVQNLFELLEKQNKAAQEQQNKAAPEPGPVFVKRTGMSLDDFANPGASIADFTTGSWVLDEATRGRLREFARLVLDHADVRSIIIQGSADDVGNLEINTMISRERATAVFNELTRLGVPVEKLGLKVSVFMRAPSDMTAKDKQSQRQVLLRVSRKGEE